MVISDVLPTLIALILQSLWRSKRKALSEVGEAFQKTVFKLSKQYHDNFYERHGTIKVLGMHQPISLEHVYVDVEIWEHHHSLAVLNAPESIERVYREQRRGLFELDQLRQSGLEVVNDVPYLVVLGGPGTGKSTFLRKMGLIALEEPRSPIFRHNCLPIFIELKELRFSQFNLRELIQKEFEICGFPDCDSFTDAALTQGKLLILLDGLDEVPPASLTAVIREIQDFVDLYDKNRYIISCRSASYQYRFKRFTDVTISQFGDHQILNFILNWFKPNILKGRECWRKLSSPEYASTKELSHTPLLLTLICMLYERAGQFPTNRATLYERAFRILLEEWSGEKGLTANKIYRGLDTKRKEILLAEIAYTAFEKGEVFISERQLLPQIEQIIKEMLPSERYVDAQEVLREIEISHGVLVKYVSQVYMFSHLTFQEYLTAQYIVDASLDVRIIVAEHLRNPHWQEVFLLLAGLQQADQLLLMMERQAQMMLTSPRVMTLLGWAHRTTKAAESPLAALARRAIALFLAFDIDRAFSVDLDRTKALDLDLELAHRLAKTLYPDLYLNAVLDINIARALEISYGIEVGIVIAQKFADLRIFSCDRFRPLIARLRALKLKVRDYPNSPELRHQTFLYMHQIWLHTLGLEAGTLSQLGYTDLAQLNDYLRVVLLIVGCKHASIRVSHRTWSEVQRKLLMPPLIEA